MKYSKSPVQVLLQWDLQKGVVTMPRSGKPNEIIFNAQIFDFELTEHDMNEINNLNQNNRIFPYYDKIPFLVKAFSNNKQKISIVTELTEATFYKTKNRLKMMINPKSNSKSKNNFQ